MAFESVNGQKVFSSVTGITYIFADYFVVFQGEAAPVIYDWGDINSVTESMGRFTISTKKDTYNIERSAFTSEDQFLNVRAIIEGQIAVHPNIHYKFNKRILPLKYLYKNLSSPNAFVMNGYYEEKVINSCNISLVSARFGRYIFFLALALIAVIFLILVNVLGSIEENWIYCLPISIFTGIIASVVIYLVVGIIARHKFNAIQKVDIASTKEITIVVAPEGFAAVESSVYTGHDLIPWNEANFFIETHVGIVILRDNKSVCWIPKSFIPKNETNNILGLISSRVKQR